MLDRPPGPIRVLIIDDHRVFAESLARLLIDESDLAVVAVATSGNDGVLQAASTAPDVVLVDYQMPGLDGVTTATRIKAADAAVKVVMLTASDDDRVLVAAIEAGCSGFITKDRAASDVADAVRSAAAGEALISPAMLARLLPKFRSEPSGLGADLSDREREVLDLMAKGQLNKEIAAALYLSVNTVRNYVQSVLTKLGAHSKLEAVAAAAREGIVRYDA